jgi:hypothetical protein
MAWEKEEKRKGAQPGGKTFQPAAHRGPNELARNVAVSGLDRAVYTNMATKGHNNKKD